ncbi:MAG: response regulator [Spirochaetota bacterium]
MDFPEAVDILLVEDNPHDTELTRRALKKLNLDVKLYVVEDGWQALEFLFCEGIYKDRNIIYKPKVIMLDLKLPKVDGLKVLTIIKADQRTNRIPVVILSSSKEDPDIKTAYDLGANSYVVKPVDFDSFMDSISHLGFYWLLVNQWPK